MHKDLKTGLVLGLILAAVGAVWISTRPALTTEARVHRNTEALLRSGNTELLQSITTQPIPPTVAKTPDSGQQLGSTPAAPPAVRFNKVRSGETLSDISYKYYDSANKWQKIYNANRRTIKNPNVLTPGTKIVIP